MSHLHVKNFGPIADANIEFGDLTVLVGPQATGKSMLLQLWKLLHDSTHIRDTIRQYGFDWSGDPNSFLELYFGEGMSGIWRADTQISADRPNITLKQVLNRRSQKFKREQVYVVPAQRVITFQDGWPRPFNGYAVGDPFVVKWFSEHLRTQMEQSTGSKGAAVFPSKGRMKSVFRKSIDESIFHGSSVELDSGSLKKRIMLSVGGQKLPYMAWSAGQREFMPLLLSLYYLMPPSAIARRDSVEWVIIEEPEMGLHPRAIQSLLMLMLELMYRGYKVIVSTHSPVVLEMVWAIKALKETMSKSDLLFRLFDLKHSQSLQPVFNAALNDKSYHAYYFSPEAEGVVLKDMSSLDPFADDAGIADWGGLTAFSTRVSDIISEAYAKL